MPLIHFLLVYDLVNQRLLEQLDFSDADEAAAAYTALERKHHSDPHLEIVLVGADSIATIMTTHRNYFEADESVPSPFLEAVS